MEELQEIRDARKAISILDRAMLTAVAIGIAGAFVPACTGTIGTHSAAAWVGYLFIYVLFGFVLCGWYSIEFSRRLTRMDKAFIERYEGTLWMTKARAMGYVTEVNTRDEEFVLAFANGVLERYPIRMLTQVPAAAAA